MVGIRPGNQKNHWSVCLGNLMQSMGEVGNMQDLKAYFEAACKSEGISLVQPPSQQHTTSTEPLSVWVKLKSMVGLATIDAIYDPYLDILSLDNLSGLYSLGAKFSSNLRLGTFVNRINKNWLSKFNEELKIEAKLRICRQEHLRLIFLSDGRCLSPDFSLNKEQVGTISTVETAPKLVIFNDLWNNGDDIDAD